MSRHPVALEWSRSAASFDYETYNRSHDITFKSGRPVRFSSAVAYRGDADCVDPEEAFVASLASCHMLTFLAIAAKRGYVVDAYRDEAIGHLEKNNDGKLAMTRVELMPIITFAEGRSPDEHALNDMHEKAHDLCFIANSVRTRVSVRPQVDG